MVYLITAEQLGISDEGPGINLMNNFLHELAERQTTPEAIALVNKGVKLAAEGSGAFEDLKRLSKRGCDVLACGMCLKHYGLIDKVGVGRISNMAEITGILDSAERTVTL